MGIITDRGTCVAFFTFVLLASTWYYIRKAKQQANDFIHEGKMEGEK